MRRVVAGGVLAACLLGLPAAAAGPPDSAKVRRAADEFDAGADAFKRKDYEGAATHFEAAHTAVPSAKALRMAIRARAEAGQGSRAATLAASALDRYPNDADTKKLATDTIAKLEPLVHRVAVSCAPPCVVAVGDAGQGPSAVHAVPGEPTTRWTVYLDPGTATVRAKFLGGATAEQSVDAKAGGKSDLRLEPGSGGATPAAGASAAAPSGAAASDASSGAAGADSADTPPDEAPKPRGSGLSPVFFVSGAIATAALAGVTVWSGIDTENNPGPDAVRQACKNQGESCPEYRDGRARQLRTNVLLGTTIGVGVLTAAVGVFFTNWHGSKRATPTARAIAVPVALDHGGGVAAAGRF